MWREDASNVPVTVIPTQNRVTLQILNHWPPFTDLKQVFVISRRAEQFRLRTQQRIVATVEDSVLRTEMENLESQEEDTPRRVLWFKPMSWLGQIRPHRRDEAWSASHWQTFFKFLTSFAQPTKSKVKTQQDWVPYECVGSGTFGAGSPHRPRPFWQ